MSRPTAPIAERPVRWPWVALAYPPWVHLCLFFEHPTLAVAGLAVLLAAGAAELLSTRRHGAAALCAGAALVAALTAALGTGLTLLYLPPVAFTLALLVLFGTSLLPGRTPLITVIAARMGEPPEAAMRRYTRRVTAAWTAFFALLLLLNSGLALWAPAELWSWFANFGNHLLVALFFWGEHRIRGRYLPGHRYRRLSAFLRALPGAWRGPIDVAETKGAKP